MQDLPVRPGFWNVPLWAEIGVYVLGLSAVALMICGIVRIVKLRRAAGPRTPFTFNWSFFLATLKEVFLQTKVRQTTPGKMHFALFWGFFFLFLGTATATLDWDIGHYLFKDQFLKGWVYLAYKLILDVAGVMTLIALSYGFCRRYLTRDPAIEHSARFIPILGSLFLIVLSGFFVEALRLAVQQPAWAAFSPVGHAISLGFAGLSADTLKALHTVFWVGHGLAALAFVAAIPFTYYAHLAKTPTSVYWRKREPAGAIAKIENIEEQESFGVSNFDQFSDLDRIRFDACTECGRCRMNCPAVKAGTPLDPKNLILSLRNRMQGKDKDKELIGGIVSADALWSCTTCMACTNVCPARIPIHEFIVSMRRHLALEQGQFPEGLAGALENTATVGNPWGMDPGSRMNWAKGLDVPKAAAGEELDVLYWVGCSASYDKRAQKIAKAMVRIFRACGVRFAVMAEERCHADWARRAGEEYLFQTAVQENIENLGKYRFKEIVTACPHCFNTLKNEFPQFDGGSFTVTDHASFILRMIENGKLPAAAVDSPVSVTLHDACYLARYNNVTEEPRTALSRVGIKITEAGHNKKQATCCGAGGAQIFMDRPARINTLRFQELSQTQAGKICVTCPHCLTMLTSAKANEKSDAVIEDIAEIVAAQLLQTNPSEGEA